jgi:hypothetical protein
MIFAYRKTTLLFFCLLVIAVLGATTVGQSGRRQPKNSSPAPVPTPAAEPTPSPKAVPKKSEISFVIAADRSTSMQTYFLSYYDAAMRGCADKIQNSSSANVDVANQPMNRSEGSKKAKAEKTTYVVLIELSGPSMSSNPTSDYDEVELSYVVFAPETGKIATSGRAYYNSRRAGPVVVGPSRGSSSSVYRETMLRQVGEEAGERILKALNISSGGVIRN